MATQLNPNAIVDHSITAVKLAGDAITSDASVAAWGYTKNTGTLTGVTFNNTAATVTNGVAAITATIPAAITETDVSNWGFTKNTGTITGITMNGASKGTSGVVNLGTVITDVSGKADKSAAIGSLSLSLDSTNYKITLSGTMVDGSAFTVSDVIDLPLESVVVDGSYNNTTKKVVLTLQSGSTVEFSVADLVAGLQSEITSSNKLSADLISDGTTNKVVTATEKSTWNGKQDAISDLETIRANASAGAAKVSNVQSDWNATSGLAVILNKPTIPAAPGTLKTNNTTAQTASSGEALSGTINLHKVAKTGTYSDLIGTPTIPAAVTETDVSSWGFTKNTGTITGITMNSASKGTSGVVDLGTVITAHAKHKLTATNDTATATSGSITFVESLTGTTTATDGDLTVTATRKSVTIPAAPGTLNTSINTAQTTSNSEALSGTINLHKVAKTGTYSDLIGTPAEVTSSTVSGWGFTKNTGTITGINMNGSSKGTSGVVDLGTVITSETALSKGTTSGNGNAVTDISVNGHQITLTKGSTFLTSHQSIKTINGNTMTGTGNVSIREVPAVTSSDNGKVLMVVNGAWAATTPVSIYSGSDAPNNSQGINGDLYLQI